MKGTERIEEPDNLQSNPYIIAMSQDYPLSYYDVINREQNRYEDIVQG
jgi:hypothetical protein